MPQETYFNLNAEKRDRVYQAVLNEFIRVPLEDASIKNIVNDAGIPRGSFYQYFIDKEDALRFLISQTRNIGENELINNMNKSDFDLYNFVEFIYVREVNFLEDNIMSQRIQLLNQISRSPRATTLFYEEITKTITQNQVFKQYWENSGLNHISEKERDVVIDLLFTSLKEALLTALQNKNSITTAHKELKLKIKIIREGIKTIFEVL